MSTFTDWNGPNGAPGYRAGDLADMVQRYQAVLSNLQAHIDATPGGQDVHHIKEYIEPLLNECAKTTDILSRLESYAKLTDIPDLAAYVQRQELNPYAKKVELEHFVVDTTLDRYLKTADLDTQHIITVMRAAIKELQDWFIDPASMADFKHVVKTSSYFEGMVHALEQIDFTDRREAAYIGGSDAVGVYYILGMFVGKAGTVYIKYVDDKPFSAAINFAVTPELKGELSVTTDSDLQGLKFKIVKGTDKQGTEHLYLAIQSTEWIPKFISYDGTGMFSTIDFEVSGINFVPINSAGWQKNNGSCSDVCDCVSGRGFSFSKLASVVLDKRIFMEEGNPYITHKDVKPLDAIGTVIYWDDWQEDAQGNRFAVNVPDGYHACNGTPVLPEDDVDEEFRAKYRNYPVADYCMIKTRQIVGAEGD